MNELQKRRNSMRVKKGWQTRKLNSFNKYFNTKFFADHKFGRY